MPIVSTGAWCRMSDDSNRRFSWTLFEEPYWLDAVAPGDWHAIEVRRDGRILGRLPYMTKRRYGLRALSTPWYTPWLGPWIQPAGAKPANELSHQHQTLELLIEGLPKAHRTLIPCAPEFRNLMAFHWADYQLELGYTYRLTDLGDEQRLWNGLRDTVRRLCRKAEKITAVNRGRDIATFIGLLEKTFARQGMDMSSWFPALERIDETMSRRNQRTIYSAEDAQGRVHAAVYVVYDDRHTFYLAGGGDPALRDSGAHSLAMWHAIKESGTRSQIFDFEGSMLRTIEYFIRGFGPQQCPRFTARRSSHLIKLIEAAGSLRSRF
jgi:hypothetical protein